MVSVVCAMLPEESGSAYGPRSRGARRCGSRSRGAQMEWLEESRCTDAVARGVEVHRWCGVM